MSPRPGPEVVFDAGARGRPLEGRRVLLVEDEPLIVMDMSFTFEEAGAAVRSAGDVASALALLDEALPDVAVLDVNLSRGTTCAPIAERLRAAGVPFVLHSGDLDRLGERIDRLDAPIVLKPASGAALVQAVVEAL